MSCQRSDPKSSVRLRGFNKTNLWAWVVTIENDSYTSCSFKNCNFMAFDVEEMHHHYSLCHSSYTAKHICSTCMRGTDTEAQLFKHKLLQHTNEVTFADVCYFDTNEDTLTACSRPGRTVSKVMLRSWEVTYDKRAYIKCLVPTCYFVTSDLKEMEIHFEHFCTPAHRKSLTFTCPICRGRCERPDDLKKHIEKNHSNAKKVNKVTPGVYEHWKAVLSKYCWARCCSPGCYFIDSDINVLQEHYIYCKDPSKGKLLECEGCHGWLCGLNKLVWHIRDIHDPKSPRAETYMRLTNWREKIPEEVTSVKPPRYSPLPLMEDDSNSGELVIVEVKEEVAESDGKELKDSHGTASANKEVAVENNIKQYERKKLDKKVPTIYPAFVPKSTKQIDCKPSLAHNVQFPNNYVSTHEWILDFSSLPVKRSFTRMNKKPVKVTNSVKKKDNGCDSVIEKIAEKVMADSGENSLVPVTIQVNNDLSWTVHAKETTNEGAKQELLKEFSLEDKFKENFIERTDKDLMDVLDRASKFAVVRNNIYNHKYSTRSEAKELLKVSHLDNSSASSEEANNSDDDARSFTEPLNSEEHNQRGSRAISLVSINADDSKEESDIDGDLLDLSSIGSKSQIEPTCDKSSIKEKSSVGAKVENTIKKNCGSSAQTISDNSSANNIEETSKDTPNEIEGNECNEIIEHNNTFTRRPNKRHRSSSKKDDFNSRETCEKRRLKKPKNESSRKSSSHDEDVVSKKQKISLGKQQENVSSSKRVTVLKRKNGKSIRPGKSFTDTEADNDLSDVKETHNDMNTVSDNKISGGKIDSSKINCTSRVDSCSESNLNKMEIKQRKLRSKEERMSTGSNQDLGLEDHGQDMEIDEILGPPVLEPEADACESHTPEVSRNSHAPDLKEKSAITAELKHVSKSSMESGDELQSSEVGTMDGSEVTSKLSEPSLDNVQRFEQPDQSLNHVEKSREPMQTSKNTDDRKSVNKTDSTIDPCEESRSSFYDTQWGEDSGREVFQSSSEMIVPDDGGGGIDEEVVPSVLIEVRRSRRNRSLEPPVLQRAAPPRARKTTAALDLLQSLGDRITPQSFISRPDREVTCSICSKKMTVLFYKNKHLDKHNFVCWLEGEEPLPTDNQGVMTLVLNRGLRAFPNHKLCCKICGKVSKSALGFFTHMQRCGKSFKELKDLKEQCPVCSKYMSRFALQNHQLTMHRVTTEADISPPPSPVTTSTPVPKRKSASKSKEMLEGLTDDNEAENDEQSENDADYEPNKNQKRKLAQKLMMDDENGEKTLFCPTVDCDFGCKSVQQMRLHHKSCQQQGSISQFQTFNCKMCNYKTNTKESLKGHLKVTHGGSLLIGSEQIHTPIPFLKQLEDEVFSNKHWVKHYSFLTQALKWTKEIRQQVYTSLKEFVFPDLRVTYEHWNELKVSRESYLPSLSTSVRFRVETGGNWHTLNRFETKTKIGEGTICCAGGPIWALAWCPTPDAELRDQHLALSTHQLPSLSYLTGQTYTHPSVIQLWSFGLLLNNRKEREQALLSYGLCTDEGCVWDLEWCPSGAQDSTRLGLLAAAFSSGSINIYALPPVEQLNYPSNSPPFYKPAPVLQLHLNGRHKYQCKRISWSKTKPHKIIVGGFVNGLMAVWDLTISSTLLRQGSIMYPCRVVQAHLASINSVSMSPLSEDHVLSCSMDRSVKVWDLKDLTAPLQTLTKGCCTDADWLTHWIGFTVGYDNGYMTNSSTGMFSSLRDFSFYPHVPFLGSITETVMGISHNDWLHCLAYGLENGNVVTVFGIRQIGDGSEARKKRIKYSLKASLKLCEPAPPGRKKKNTIDLNTPSDSGSYPETAAKFGVEFSFHSDIDEFVKNITDEKSRKDVYPIISANKVSFNPNAQSFLSLAVGYESGLVVISSLRPPKQYVSAIDEITFNKV